MKSTYSVIFYMKKEKARKDGTYPIFGRITIDGAKSHFSCKIYCKPDIWEVNGGHAIFTVNAKYMLKANERFFRNSAFKR